MNKFLSFALGAAAGALFAGAPAWAAQDSQAWRSANDKAAADYRGATASCASEQGNDKQVCLQQAKVDRARATADATEQYRASPTLTRRARVALANAEYGLARAKCAAMTGVDKSTCLDDAKTSQSAALADARGGARANATAAMADCERMEAGAARTACLGRNVGAGGVADTTGRAGAAVADTAQRTKDAAAGAAQTTGKVVADSVITTKIKADMVREPDLKAMDVHVETVNGVVMLSGFVESQQEADKAVQVARGVEGVTDVRSALKVK